MCIATQALRSRSIRPSFIYQYQPNQILPLIKSHLPASVTLYGVLATPPSSGPHSPDVKIWSTIPHPPNDDPIPPNAEGTIILEVLSDSGNHLRIFDTLESTPNIGRERLSEGEERVVGALRAFLAERKGSEQKIGGLHERWISEVINQLGDGIDPIGQGVWLPPKGWENDCEDIEGYEVDIGREEDVQSFSDNSDIDRDINYYKSRLPYSTIIRPTSSSPTQPLPSVCRVLTHANGSIGTLSTDSDHRRKGLAQWIVRAHLASGRGWIGADDASEKGEGRWTYAVIFDRNLASQGMFRGMGWVRGWSRAWVTISEQGSVEDLKED